MRVLRATALVGALACICGNAVSQSGHSESRTITVKVTVRDSSGSAVSGLAVGVVSGSRSSLSKTEASGSVTLTASIPSDMSRVYVMPMPYTRLETSNEQAEAVAKYVEVTNANKFERVYSLDLVEGTSMYTLNIDGTPAFKASLRAVRSGAPVEFSVIHPYILSPRSSNDDGAAVVVGGLPVGTDALLFLYTEDEAVHVVTVRHAAAGSTVAVGDIELGANSPGRKVAVHVNDVIQLKASIRDVRGRDKVLTFVRASDGRPFCVNLDKEGDTHVGTRGSRPVAELPVGTFYMCPGMLDGTGAAMKLYKLILAGRVSEVESAGVPKIVVDSVTGNVMMMSIDGVAAEAAVESVAL